MSHAVLFERRDASCEIILNRPERLNAISPELVADGREVLEDVRHRSVRAALLRGAGRAFCAGGDVKIFAERVAEGEALSRSEIDPMHRLFEELYALPKPLVAAVHGACAGAGLSLLLTCDLALAADDAVFDLAYLRVGLSPDGGASYLLPRHLGLKRATELLLRPRKLSAHEALELGLINQVLPASELLEGARALVAELAAGPTQAYANVKQLLRRSFSNDLRAQLSLESELIRESSETEDFREGVRAFVEHRAPHFIGR